MHFESLLWFGNPVVTLDVAISEVNMSSRGGAGITKDEFIVSRIYRMPIYRTFLYIEEYIVSNLPYRVSRYSQNQWFFCLFSPKIPKILRKFWKFPENSENPWTKVVNNNNSAENSKNSPKILKIRRKFLKKKVFFEALISYRIVSYREKNPHIVSISYRIEKKHIATGWPPPNAFW